MRTKITHDLKWTILLAFSTLLLISFHKAGAQTVSQEDFMALIESVQINSQKSYDAIQSVQFEGYSKTYAYFGYNPLEVDMVPLLNEYYIDGYWMKPDSLRMVIKALRDVRPDSNEGMVMKIEDEDMPLPNPFHFSYDASALGLGEDENDEEITMWPLHPFSVGADSMYNYRLESEVGFGENRIFIIYVEPKIHDMPGVIGSFMIDAHRHEVVGSDIQFNEATSIFQQASKEGGPAAQLFIAGGANNHRIKTRKELHYGSYWLPVTMEEEFSIMFWGMDVKIHRDITFDTYIVNPEDPDPALLTDQKVVYARDPEFEKAVFKDVPDMRKISHQEFMEIVDRVKDHLTSTEMYKELLSTSEALSLEASKMALTNRFGRHIQFVRSLGDYFVYNRIEGLRTQYTFVANNWPVRNLSFSLGSGYGIADHRWKGEASLLYQFTKNKRMFIEANLFNTLGCDESRKRISTANNTFSSLWWKEDNRDYYYKKGWNLGLGVRPTDQSAIKILYASKHETIAPVNTRFSIFKGRRDFRNNPEILAGVHRGLTTSLLYRAADLDVDCHFTLSEPEVLKSDFDFQLITARLAKRWRLTRHTDIHLDLDGLYAWGALPPQRWFDFGGRSFLDYHGNLRSVGYKAFTGDRAAKGVLEYAIKGGVLEALGFNGFWVNAIKLSIWGGAGWSDLSDKSLALAQGLNVPSQTTDELYGEIGISVGDPLNIFRFDVIRTFEDHPETLFRFNILR